MESKLIQICILCRYLSLTACTAVYLFFTPSPMSLIRCLVAAGVICSSILGAVIYQKNISRIASMITMGIEVVACGLFIILSGGCSSPYLWYSICSLTLVMASGAARVLTVPCTCWLILCVLMGRYLGISGAKGTYLEVNVFMGFLIFAGSFYALFLHVRKLSEVRDEVVELRTMVGEAIIAEEQNRIADEIHDTVIQKLFAVACSLHVVSEKKKLDQEIQMQLEQIGKAVESVMRELRETIYGLRWNGENQELFGSKLAACMDEISELNEVPVHLSITGPVDLMSIYQKTVIYRILCEAVNNGIHHGGARTIKVTLQVSPREITGLVIDDGQGFEAVKHTRNGCGLKNMRYLAGYLGGQLTIRSGNQGTTIAVTLPR